MNILVTGGAGHIVEKIRGGHVLKSRLMYPSFILALCMSTLCYAGSTRITAGRLNIDLDKDGTVALLSDSDRTQNFIHPKVKSSLLQVKPYSSESALSPLSINVVTSSDATDTLRFRYRDGIAVDVRINKGQDWLSCEIIGGEKIEEVQEVTWGPINTVFEGPVGEFFGVLRNDHISFGMMSLNPNTDGIGGEYPHTGAWLPFNDGGSCVTLFAHDHSRSIKSKDGSGDVVGVPGMTVLRSKVGIYMADRGHELDVIEAIVIAEKMPYPQYKGQWSKRSKELLRPAIWGHFGQHNIDEFIDMTARLTAVGMCGFHTMFGNWGHFEPDPHEYPNGDADLKKAVAKTKAKDVALTFYTLTNFLTEKGMPEPYLSPVADERLRYYTVPMHLAKPISADDTTLSIVYDEQVMQLMKKAAHRCVLRVENELIRIKNLRKVGNEIQVDTVTAAETKNARWPKNCGGRGYEFTTACAHPKNAKIRQMVVGAWFEFYPGTLDMSDEVAHTIGRRANKLGFGKVTLDGHESALRTGHGYLAMNRSAQIVYDHNKKRDIVMTGSRITNYCWNLMSYISWGELQRNKGFRGTMLDYRINRVSQLQRSLMPAKLGQHYPDKNTTVDDINWLMSQAVGWDAGIEFHIDLNSLKSNKNLDEIVKTLELWEEARLSGKITDAQKLQLRQVDAVHSLSRAADGNWKITFENRWMYHKLTIADPSAIELKPVKGDVSIQPRSIEIDGMHAPMIAKRATLSNDVVVKAGKESALSVSTRSLQFVLRLSKKASGPIRNPRFTVGEQTIVVPVTLQPGQYICTPVNYPIVSVYDENDKIIDQVHIRHSNSLPRVNKRAKSMIVKFFCEGDATSEVKLNFYGAL